MTLFQDFLASAYSKRRYLVELYPYDPVAAQVKSLYFSTDGVITQPADSPANTYFEPRVAQALKFTRSLFQPGRIGGKSIPGFGTLTLRNEDGGLDALAGYAFDGRRVVVRLGGEGFGYTDFGIIYDGTADGIEFTDRAVVVRLRDLNYKLAIPLQTAVYAGTGGWEGGPDVKGKVKPKAYGLVRDAEPVLVDLPTLRYQINDGRIQAITAVKDRAVPLTFDADYATAAALDAATVPGGRYATCLLEGRLRLGSKPVGTVTIDGQGDAAAGVYVASVADIVQRLVKSQAGLTDADLVTASFSNLNLANPATVGLYVREPIQLDEALDALANSIGAWYGFRRDGKFDIGRLEPPAAAPVLSFTKTEILRNGFKRLTTQIPPWRLTLNYRRCWTPMSGTQLDVAGVSDAQRAFMEKPYRTVVAEDAAVKTAHLLSQPVEYVSLIDDPVDAQAECNRVHAIEKADRAIYEVTAKVQPFQLELGQEIEIKTPRYGLAAGKSFRVISMDEDSRANRVTMEVWG